MNEDYVSFETAKLLKEKGFDVETEHELWYVVEKFSTGCHWNSCTYKVGDITREYDEKYCIAMPTLQMAMKWLRIEHNIHIEILMTNHSISERFDIPKYYWVAVNAKTCKWITESTVYSAKQFDTNEEACEEAIKYCLENLINK